jgi:ABC-type antimicrobial peptide transport system permease subunit
LVTDRLEPQIRPWRIAAALFLLFGLLALSAASAGIYGLVGYEVTQRTHEFGVRITLGATSRAILSLVLESSARIVAIGLIAGVGAALWSGRLLSALLFETSPYDPVVLVVTAASLSFAALCASLVPAWRATRVDPAISLRAD